MAQRVMQLFHVWESSECLKMCGGAARLRRLLSVTVGSVAGRSRSAVGGITPKPLASGTMGLDARPRGALSSSARPGAFARSGRPFPAGGCPTHVPTCWEKSTAVAVKIKLKRLGKIREPYYRIVVADARTKRDGRAIEEIGKYHPKLEPSLIEVDSERVQHWLSVGAQPTEAVQHLLTITGDWQKFKGLPGAEGTLKTAEPKADKKERYEKLVKESLAAKETKARKAGQVVGAEEGQPRRPRRRRTRRPRAGRRGKAADAKAAEAKAAEAKAAEAKAAEAKAPTLRPPRPRPQTRRGPPRLLRRLPTAVTEPEVLEEALEHLVRGIVTYPDDVRVANRMLRRGNVLEVRVHPDDLGKVIGRGGRTARALRTVIGSLAGNRHVRIDLLETGEVR